MKISKPLYYMLNCTWGCIMNTIGAIVALALVCIGKKPKKHAGCVYFNVGKSWGGMELGCFFLTDEHDCNSTKNHEFGHSLQNCLWGPLFPFVICIPSAIRYWLREFKTQRGKYLYATVLSVSIMLLGAGLAIIGNFVSTWLFVIGLLLFVYGVVIASWLLNVEIPQYESGKYIDYDSIWFESQASKWGEKVSKDW